MKHLIFLLLCTVGCSVASLFNPFWAVLLYYGLAVLRPQNLWDWSLPVDYRWSLMAAVAMVVGFVLNSGRILWRGRLNTVTIMMGVYACLIMLSCLTAYNPGMSFTWGIETGKVLFIAVMAALIVHTLGQVRLLLFMVFAILGYLAWQVNSLYLFDGRLDIFHYGYAGFDNNGAALMLAMGLPMAYACTLCVKHPLLKAACIFAALCILHAVLLSYSRGAMLAGGVALGWLLLCHRPRWQAALLTVAIVLVLSLLAGEEVRHRFETTFELENNASAQSRFASWEAAWQIAMEHPFLGKGVRNTALFTHNYGADLVGRGVHSQYLQIAADVGIPAMFLYIAMLSTAWLFFGRARRQCLDAASADDLADRLNESDRHLLMQIAALSRGCQGSLLLFAVGSAFLSMETFELPWMLMAVGGLLPAVVQQHIQTLLDTDPADRTAAAQKPRIALTTLWPGTALLRH